MSDMRTRRASLRSVLALSAAGLLTAAPAVADDNVERVEPVLGYSAVAGDETLAGTAADFASPASEDIDAEPAIAAVLAQGVASYYGHEFAGSRTANGERYNPNGLTAAHRSLPMGSKLRVTNTANGKSVMVRVNDRGPFHGKRILDVSLAAAQKIGMVRAGKALVKLELLR